MKQRTLTADNRSELQRRIDGNAHSPAEEREHADAIGLGEAWRETAWACDHAEWRLERPCCGGRGVCRLDPVVPVGVTGRQCNALHCPFDSYQPKLTANPEDQ
jgi:hypothetical protein